MITNPSNSSYNMADFVSVFLVLESLFQVTKVSSEDKCRELRCSVIHIETWFLFWNTIQNRKQ